MPHADQAVRTAYMRAYQRKAREAGICLDCRRVPAVQGGRCSDCLDRRADRRRERRQEALDHYGGRCVCCGEGQAEFLTFDHVNNDGAAMRRALPATRGGGGLIGWLHRNGYPTDFQILCCNCNYAKFRYGCCPHQNAEAA
jgi:hypothetical protein